MAEARIFGRRPLLKTAGAVLATSGVLATGGWAIINRDRNLVHIRRERTLMQTSVAVNVIARDTALADHAIEAAFRRMASVAGLLNRFDPRSSVARLNRDGRLSNPPAPLRTVLARALSLSNHTDGDFDVSVAPVLDYFLGLGRPVHLTPAMQHIVSGREALVGFRSISLETNAVRLMRPGMRITLDGIAKGHVVDEGIAALREAGITDALVDAGGDLRAIASNEGKRSWNVGIVDPRQTDKVAAVVRLQNGAISTSGNYEVFFTADHRLFHIINPHTGYSPTRYSSVTVLAEDAMESDAMGVAAFSMPLPRLQQVMARRGNQWLVFSWDGTQRWRSRGLPLVSGEARVA